MKIFIISTYILALGIEGTLVRSQGFDCQTGDIPDVDRFDCYPESDSSEQGCRLRNCTWCRPQNLDNPGIPWCFYNEQPSIRGYIMVGTPIQLPNGVRVNLQNSAASLAWTQPIFDGEAEFLTLEAEFQSNSRLRIKITDGTPRWEVPLQIYPSSEDNSNPLYEITFSNDPFFSFTVTRRSNGVAIFSAGGNYGDFIFAEQWLTLSWKTPTDRVYGIGENEQRTFKHDFSKNITWPLWTAGPSPGFTTNIYGAQPYYTVLEADGKAHSVAVVNSNAQEFSMISGPLIRYRTIGGLLDFYIFLGPSPENTVQQYTEAVGRPPMLPYWALGFQLCRYGYDHIDTMKEAVNRTTQYNIPLDVQYGDIDIMDRALDFTYSETNFPGLPDYIKELKTRGIKFITILDPCISTGEPPGSYKAFELGEEMNVWMKRADGTTAVGRMWPPDDVYFPDYSNPRTRDWWIILIKEFHDLLEYDGLWIDMNEPYNFVRGDINGCANNTINYPKHVPRVRQNNLILETVCPDNQEYAGKHYDTHSLYGWFESEPTLAAVREGTGKRSVVISRSTFLGSGHWTAHWLGDNFSRWSNLHYSVIGMLQFNHFGIPYVGADICGHQETATAALCQRWMELGAFYPFSRNHNAYGLPPQDPGYFGPEVADSSRRVLEIRYTLLPYLYTLFYHAHVSGNTVVRALWHEFPTDPQTAQIDRQFLWGSGLLISPVLEENALSVEAYLPSARMYSYYTGAEEITKGGFVTLPAPMDFIPLHIRGGIILPTQEPAVTTELSRSNPMGLIVALDEFMSAFGSLYFDDGDSIDPIENGAYYFGIFSAANRRLSAQPVTNDYPEMATKQIASIRLLGAGPVTQVTVNGVSHTDFTTLPSGEVVIRNLGIIANSAFVIGY